MKMFEDLLPALIGGHGLIGLPPEIGVFHLRKAAIELCERSHIWRDKVLIDTQLGVSDYPIDVPSGSALVAVRGAVIDGREVPVGANRFKCGSGVVVDAGKVYIQAPSSDDNFIELIISLKPTQDTCHMPDILYEDWADVIVSGAAGRALAMPKTDWTSGPLATLQIKMFNIGITRAKNRALLSKTIGPVMMVGSRF
jgi:hypothetical protein